MSARLRDQVGEFHATFGVPCFEGRAPTVPPDARVRLRLRLITEECVRDFIENTGTAVELPAFADALADLDYVIEGTRLEFGIDGAPIAAAVHRANMAKLGGGARKDGKIQKPKGWQPPDIAGELRKQGWEG